MKETVMGALGSARAVSGTSLALLCSPQQAALSCSAPAGRRDAVRTEETKPPSLWFWVSPWTAPCSRRWKCWLSPPPVVALGVIFPGKVSSNQCLWCQG